MNSTEKANITLGNQIQVSADFQPSLYTVVLCQTRIVGNIIYL